MKNLTLIKNRLNFNINLKTKLGLVFFSFVVLAMANYFTNTYLSSIQEKDALVVDVAGRQRMLSQRIAYLAMQCNTGDDSSKVELEAAIALCDSSLYLLEFGGQVPGYSKKVFIPASSDGAISVLIGVKELWLEYAKHATNVATAGSDAGKEDLTFLNENALSMMMSFNGLVNAYVRQSELKQADGQRLLLGIFLFCSVFTFLAFFVGYQSIIKPLKYISHYVRNLSRGRVGQQMDFNKGDAEVRELVNNLHALDISLGAMAGFAEQISNGDLDGQLTLLSEDDKLGISLKRMQSKLKRSVDEINHVVEQVGYEGRTSMRINHEDKMGAWKALSVSLNELLSAVDEPIRDINKTLEAMANGDLSNRCETNAKGSFKTLIDNLNASQEALLILLREVSSSSELVHNYSEEMMTVGQDMNVSTEEIASAIGQISSGAQDQVFKIEETSERIESIFKSSNEMQDLSRKIDLVADNGVEIAQKGNSYVKGLVEVIKLVAETSERADKSMRTLNERSGEISRVLSVISDIAAQTNLLALNAAIEAAQAGDYGRGFAVVAEEIRKLAEDSKKSAGEIEKLITDVQRDTADSSKMITDMKERVKDGVKSSSSVSDVFDDISSASTETLSHSREITNSIRLQTENAKNIVSSSGNVLVVAEQTSAATEEVASSAAELAAGMKQFMSHSQSFNEISSKLRETLNMFILEKEKETALT